MDFLADVYRFGLELAVSRKGGFEGIAFRRQRRTKAPIRFVVTTSMTLREVRPVSTKLPDGLRPDTVIEIRHSFALQARRTIEADYRVSEETLTINVPDVSRSTPILEIDRAGSRLEASVMELEGRFWSDLLFPFNEQRIRSRLERQQADEADLIVSTRAYVGTILTRFVRFHSRLRVFQLTATSARLPGASTPSPELGRSGENLPAFVRYMSRTKAWPEVMNVMRRVVPGLESIETDFTFDRRLTLRFKEEGLVRPWSSAQVSDGTLQALSLLCALHDPRSDVVVIEEPENSLHPWIIREFVGSARRATSKSIILTTHSPTVLDELEPQEIVVVSRVDGATQMRRLDELEPAMNSLLQSSQLSLFDLLDTGLIPPAVPLD
jgi:predicted ATPase